MFSLVQYEHPMKKVCKENPRIQLIGEMNRCDIQIQVRGIQLIGEMNRCDIQIQVRGIQLI